MYKEILRRNKKTGKQEVFSTVKRKYFLIQSHILNKYDFAKIIQKIKSKKRYQGKGFLFSGEKAEVYEDSSYYYFLIYE